MSSPRTVTLGPVIVRPLATPDWLPLDTMRGVPRSRLGQTVDKYRVDDRGQWRDRNDRLDPRARDIEVDRVRRAGGGVGIEDRLAERAGPLSPVLLTTKVDSSVRSSITSRRGRRRYPA